MRNGRIVRYAARLFLAVIIGLALLGSLPATVQADGNPIDLELGGEGATRWDIGKIMPGDSGTKTVTLHNAGGVNGFVTIWISDIEEVDYGGDGAVLDDYLLLNISCSRLDTNISLPAKIRELPQDASDANHIKIDPLYSGETVTLVWEWEFPETGEPQNDAQGDSLSFTINYMVEVLPAIEGKIEVTAPPGQTGYVVDASALARTKIIIDTEPDQGEVTITILKYVDNPHPEAPLPASMLPLYIDIAVDNADAIIWPMHVEQTYTDAELDESSLKMYYFKAGAWNECSHTGVNTAAKYVWADMTRDEVSGSPVAIGGGVAPAFSGGAPPVPVGTTDLRGRVSSEGRFYKSLTLLSFDRLCQLKIERGTIGLTWELRPLTVITMLIMDKPPPPPGGTRVIGLVYDFQPSGATFEPPITLECNYDPSDIPEGIAEEDLVIAYYDKKAGEWLNLECTVHPETNTISAFISHFTAFTILGHEVVTEAVAFVPASLVVSPIEVDIGETVNVTISVANTGDMVRIYKVTLKINGVAESIRYVTVAAGHSQKVTFTVSREVAGSYSLDVDGLSGSFTVKAKPAPPVAPPPEKPPVQKQVNWPILGGTTGTVVAIGLLAFFLARRKAQLTKR